ncbi:deoxynucleoside monophosphate kinase [Sinorhizobium phage phiM9]|uniref:DNMP kinase n=1 Tax=Sinorhizobium phage phiM9 TaxID=1636182 RepID=A0A0F6TGZ7_9CAUD|nr:deoxynucleoside monophosphate kinase [Sinorhizobium phage phiM9]AKE44634.1 hypothetical protein Sm_phiM9_003 [Sinorhizobium phage phiM9]
MIVGLIGYKNAGKTQITQAFRGLYPELPVRMIGFSNPLYKMLGVLGITEDEIQDKPNRNTPHPKLGGKSIQFALNSLGTDWGRKMIHENIWTDRAMDDAQSHLINFADNVRFPNEFDAVIDRDGLTVAIINPNVCDDGTAPEAHIADLQEQADYKLFNDPAKKSLNDCANELYQAIIQFRLNKCRTTKSFTLEV